MLESLLRQFPTPWHESSTLQAAAITLCFPGWPGLAFLTVPVIVAAAEIVALSVEMSQSEMSQAELG